MKNFIKHIRETLGMTQKRFGSLIGVEPTCVSNYESGFRTPRAKTTNKIIKLALSNGIKVKAEDIYQDAA